MISYQGFFYPVRIRVIAAADQVDNCALTQTTLALPSAALASRARLEAPQYRLAALRLTEGRSPTTRSRNERRHVGRAA
jgi:hypothetical protein